MSPEARADPALVWLSCGSPWQMGDDDGKLTKLVHVDDIVTSAQHWAESDGLDLVGGGQGRRPSTRLDWTSSVQRQPCRSYTQTADQAPYSSRPALHSGHPRESGPSLTRAPGPHSQRS